MYHKKYNQITKNTYFRHIGLQISLNHLKTRSKKIPPRCTNAPEVLLPALLFNITLLSNKARIIVIKSVWVFA